MDTPSNERAVVLYNESYTIAKDVSTQIKKQKHLTWQRRADIVSPGKPLTREALEYVDAIVNATGIPYHMIAMIPIGKGQGVKPYIYADGWFLKARTDPRGIQEVKYPDISIDKESMSVMVRCIITLGTGQSFEGVVYKSLNDERQGRNSQATMTTLVNKAITQARGKAAYEAVGGTFPGLAEEYLDVAELEHRNGIQVTNPTEPTNAAQLVGYAAKQLKLSAMQTFDILGVKNLSDINDISASWATLQAYASNKGA